MPETLRALAFNSAIVAHDSTAAPLALSYAIGVVTAAPEQRLAAFLRRFTPEVARLMRAARRKMRERLPSAQQLVYDNSNFCVIGFGPSEKSSAAIFSLAAYAKGVNVFFLQGARLPDPHGLLRGQGKLVRAIRLERAEVLDQPQIRELIDLAIDRAKTPPPRTGTHRLIIKSVSATQRPRRPPAVRRAGRAKGATAT